MVDGREGGPPYVSRGEGVGGAPAYCPTVGVIRGGANVPAGVGFYTQVSIGRKVDRRCIFYGLRHVNL